MVSKSQMKYYKYLTVTIQENLLLSSKIINMPHCDHEPRLVSDRRGVATVVEQWLISRQMELANVRKWPGYHTDRAKGQPVVTCYDSFCVTYNGTILPFLELSLDKFMKTVETLLALSQQMVAKERCGAISKVFNLRSVRSAEHV